MGLAVQLRAKGFGDSTTVPDPVGTPKRLLAITGWETQAGSVPKAG